MTNAGELVVDQCMEGHEDIDGSAQGLRDAGKEDTHARPIQTDNVSLQTPVAGADAHRERGTQTCLDG